MIKTIIFLLVTITAGAFAIAILICGTGILVCRI